MSESEAESVETETTRMLCHIYVVCSIQQVTDDGAVKTKCVGAVDPQLVGASCVRVQEQVGCAVCVDSDGLVFCMRRLTLLEVDFLARTFVVVR